MLHIPKIDDYFKLLADEEMKDFVTINLANTLNLQEKNCILN